ncbi:hypothetical protein GALL_305820 [mine drainage metagenome]|uniref:Uncharacterized protein n=1 Tax=mine drainage metagenome TaxID=410659 RepID=A0A1J5R676_9ZZZZ
MSHSKIQTESGFDVGTSPHGLSADLRRTYQETRSADGSDSLVDGVAHAPQVAAIAATEAAGQPQWFFLTEDQRTHLSYAALCQIFDLEESDESEEPSVLEAIRLLNEARHILEQGRPA